jgi:hypothetical protein
MDMIRKVVALANRAVAIDDQYVYAYNTISVASNLAVSWLADHGEDPSIMAGQSEQASRHALQINKKYTTALWSLGDLYMSLAYYGMLAGIDIESSANSAVAMFQSILSIDHQITSPYSSLASVYYFLSRSTISSQQDPARSIAKGLAAVEQCYRLNRTEPQCQYLEGQLLSVRADWNRQQGQPFLADLEQASRLAKQALVQLPDEQDALLARAELALQFAEAQLERIPRPVVPVQEGLDAVDRALAGAPGLPRALALRGALLMVRGKLERDPDRQQAALAEARTALAAGFAGNPLLKRRYAGSWKEIELRQQER